MKGQDKTKEIRTFKFPNAIVRVHIPELSEEERAIRMKYIHNAAADLIRADEDNKNTLKVNQIC